MDKILEVKNLKISFRTSGGTVKAVRNISFDLERGRTVAIVGESGSGKSVFTKTFVGMLDKNGSITNGSIMYDGKDLTKFTTEKEWRTIRGKKIAMVTQDPMTSLNPLKKISFAMPISMIWPAYMTATRSATLATTPRSWVM